MAIVNNNFCIIQKEKGHKRFKFTKTVNPSSETESIPIIHYSRKNSDVPHPHTCTTTQKHPFAGQSGENLRGRHFEVWNSKLCNPEATEQTRLAAQNQIEHASSRHCKYDNSAQYYRKKSSNAMNAEALTGSSNQILVRVSKVETLFLYRNFFFWMSGFFLANSVWSPSVFHFLGISVH